MSSGRDIAQVSKKDKTWNTHKAENAEIGRLYGLEPRFERYEQRMAGCADWLEFAEVEEHDKRLKLTRASFCHVRQCPICQWRKGLARIARFMANFPAYLADSPDWVYIFVTLTTRNCDFDQLRATIRAQNDGVKKLLKRRELKGIAKGYIRTNEVTLGKDGLAHPHIHLILAVPRSYFGKFYIRQKRWVELWRESMKLDYDPRVNVKRVKMSDQKKAEFKAKEGRDPTVSEELVSGIVEVSKYAVKPEEMAKNADYLYAVTAQCFRLRFLATGGCLKDVFKDGARDAEDISDEEMLRPGTEEEPAEKASAWRQLYLWQRERRGYLLRLRRKALADPLLDSLEFQEGLTEAMRERSAERYENEKPRPEAGSVAGATCPAAP